MITDGLLLMVAQNNNKTNINMRNSKAEVTTTLFREADKTVVAIVGEGLYYGIPQDVGVYKGDLDSFLSEHPEYTYHVEEEERSNK